MSDSPPPPSPPSGGDDFDPQAQRRHAVDRDSARGAGGKADPASANQSSDDGSSDDEDKPEGLAQTGGRVAGSLGTRALADYATGGTWEKARKIPVVGTVARKVESAGGAVTGVSSKYVIGGIVAFSVVALGVFLFFFAGILGMLTNVSIPPSQFAFSTLGGDADEESVLRGTPLYIYQQVGARHDVPWTILAAIGDELTDHGSRSPYDDCNRDPARPVLFDQIVSPLTPEHISATLDDLNVAAAVDECGVDTVDDLVAWQGVTNPPIGDPDDPDQALGPFLLTSEAALEVGSAPDAAQDFEASADFVARELSRIADDLEREGFEYDPGDEEKVAEADEFWTEAAGRLVGIVAEPDGELTSCELDGGTTLSSDAHVGAAIRNAFRCSLSRAARSNDLQVVTGLPETGPTTLSGRQATRQLTTEALAVSWTFSGWDTDTCDADADLRGIFPLSSSVSFPDGATREIDPCDPVENITAAADLVAQHEAAVSPDARPSDPPFTPMVGGWAAIPGALGTTDQLEAFLTTGPHTGLTVPDACRQGVGQRYAALAGQDTADGFVGLSGNMDVDDTLTDALIAGGVLHADGPAGTAPGCAVFDVGDADVWQRTVGQITAELAVEAATFAAVRHDHVDPDFTLDATDAGEEEPDYYEGLDVPTWLPSNIDDIERLADVIVGADVHLRATAPQPPVPNFASTPLVPRLSSFELQPAQTPSTAAATDDGPRLSFGDQVVRTANTFGGTVHGDDRTGQVGTSFTSANCSVAPDAVDGTDAQQVAQLTWEIFYCQASLNGLDDQAPTVHSAGGSTRFNGANFGMANMAQQIATEAVVVGWCESGFSTRNVTGFSEDGTWRGDNGFEARSHVGTQQHLDGTINGYAGVFQMGPDQANSYIPNWEVPPASALHQDLRFNAAANITGGANFYMEQRTGTAHGGQFEGWWPWAVVNTNYGGPNVHVKVPVLPRFPSTRSGHIGQYSQNLPDWAVNPFDHDLPASTFAGCNAAMNGGSWDYSGAVPPSDLSDRVAIVGASGLACPVPGSATSYTNDWHFPRSGGRRHMGNDVFAPMGTPIFSPGSGVVSWINRTGSGTQLGNPGIAITLDDGSRWLFLHNRIGGTPSHLDVGVRVAAGERIGEVGDEGNAKGTPPHAHTELRPNGSGTTRVNPYPTLNELCPEARVW